MMHNILYLDVAALMFCLCKVLNTKTGKEMFTETQTLCSKNSLRFNYLKGQIISLT